jgi:hypothetical protein
MSTDSLELGFPFVPAAPALGSVVVHGLQTSGGSL